MKIDDRVCAIYIYGCSFLFWCILFIPGIDPSCSSPISNLADFYSRLRQFHNRQPTLLDLTFGWALVFVIHSYTLKSSVHVKVCRYLGFHRKYFKCTYKYTFRVDSECVAPGINGYWNKLNGGNSSLQFLFISFWNTNKTLIVVTTVPWIISQRKDEI